MVNHRLLAIASVGIVIIGLLVACSPQCAFDCTAKAWVDGNENGKWDEGELPLAGVQLRLVAPRQLSSMSYLEEGVTNQNGEAEVSGTHPGCGVDDYQICAQPVAGYRSTTEVCVDLGGPISWNADMGPLLFGFVLESPSQ